MTEEVRKITLVYLLVYLFIGVFKIFLRIGNSKPKNKANHNGHRG